jgi:hypothetical protein
MKIKLVLVLVLVLGLASGVFFWQLGRSSEPIFSGPTPAVPADALQATPGTEEPLSGRGTLASLLTRARNLECAVANDADPQSATEGTVFLSDGSIRGDFLTGPRGQQTPSSLIVRDNTLFLWSTIDGQSWGVKSQLNASAPAPDEPRLETQEPIGLHDDVRYECKPWDVVDGSVFVPPSTILFRDLSTILEQGMEYGTTFEGAAVEGGSTSMSAPSGGEGSCATCAALSDESAREMCEIQFGCGLQPN